MDIPPKTTSTQEVSAIPSEVLEQSSIQSTNPRVNFSEVIANDERESGLVSDPINGDQNQELGEGVGGGDIARRGHRNSLSCFQRVVGGSGHILNDMCASLWFTYFLLYMQKVAGFSDRNAAILMLLGQIVDGLSTPLIGFEADRANHCWLCRKGYGRCKSWHLVGVILVMISFPFVFSPCIGCESSDEWARAIYYAPFITIFQIGWASSQISHLALIPKMSSDILMRTELLAIRYAFTVCANISVFLLTWITLGFEDCEIDKGDASTFRTLGLISVGIGGFFSLIFHVFVVEYSDEEIKRNTLYENEDEIRPIPQNLESHSHNELVESLNNVTNVRSVASSMAISKVHAQARRRRSSSMTSKSSADREAGVCLLSDQDDHSPVFAVDAVPGGSERLESSSNQIGSPSNDASRTTVHQGYSMKSMKSLNHGKETVTLTEWLSMPQFYIVAVMYMSTRLNVNVTQSYMPLYLQESLKLQCSSVATVPLTMFCSGLVVSIFIKLINKHLGRQLAYAFGALLCIIGAILIMTLDWTPGGVMAKKGIYGIAILLGGGASAILVTSLAITADMIGNNIENGAFVYGAMSFCDKLSCGLAVMLINELKMFNNDPGFYQRVLAYTAGGCSVTGVLGVIGLTYIIYRQRKENTNH